MEEFKRASVIKKVNNNVKEDYKQSSSKFVQYEHQIYNDKGIPSLTITSNDEQFSNRYQKYSVFDRVINDDELIRNVQIISEALVKLVYVFKNTHINFFLDNAQLVDKQFID